MSNINLGLDMASLDVGPRQLTITGVLLHAGQGDNGETIDYLAGSASGNVLEIDIPNGTRAMAYAVLDGLKKRGYRYQPFTADDTITDPAIEIGDNATANSVGCVVMGIKNNHSRLMASELSAPYDEEVNHEFKYEPRTQRQFSRESAYTRSRLTINENEIQAEVARATDSETQLGSRITINANSIAAEVRRASQQEGELSSRITATAESVVTEVSRARQTEEDLYTRVTQTSESIDLEVSRATSAEGNLSSRITQNATDITAKVSKTGGSSSSFAWTLTDSSWTLTSNNSTVLKATSSGIEVSGKITATSGYIGNGSSGFTIGNTAIYNGITSMSDTTHNGLYLGTDGIRLGQGKFSVTSAGELTAKSGYIGNGSNGFTIGNTFIRNGMESRDDETNNGVYVGTNGIALGAGAFKVTSTGAVTASNMRLTGGAISIGDDGNGNPMFNVTSTGTVTARSLTMTGGSITIKDGNGNTAFQVSSTGDLTAKSGTFEGTVRASKIAYGGTSGYLNGGGISDGTIQNGKITDGTIQNGKIYDGTLQTGKMVQSIGTSLGYANFANGVFNNTEAATYMTASYYFIVRNNTPYSMSLHTHKFYERNGFIYMSSNGGEVDSVDWTGGEQGFNIADTQTYQDAVANAESVGYSNGYGVGYNSGSPNKVTGSTVIGGRTFYYVTKNDGNEVIIPYDPD